MPCVALLTRTLKSAKAAQPGAENLSCKKMLCFYPLNYYYCNQSQRAKHIALALTLIEYSGFSVCAS